MFQVSLFQNFASRHYFYHWWEHFQVLDADSIGALATSTNIRGSSEPITSTPRVDRDMLLLSFL